jgi:hypothetical protein
MKIHELEKGQAVWMSVGGEDRLCVVLSDPDPIYEGGEEVGWKVVTYDVGRQIITEHNDCRRARDDDDLFHRRPQHSNPSFAATIAAFGEAMLDYADVAVNAERAAVYVNHTEAMQRMQGEYDALRNAAAEQRTAVLHHYRTLLKQIRAVLEVPPFVLNAESQCAAIQRILAHEEGE